MIHSGGALLAARRAPGRASVGQWEFPGGKVEVGEDLRTALAREITEELRVSVMVGEQLGDDVTLVDGRPIRLVSFAATLDGPRPTSSTDHDELRWVTTDELHELNWSKPDLPMVRRLQATTD